MPALLFPILTPLFCPSSSVLLSYFSLAVPMRECLGKHSCMSSPFPIAILNGTSSFLSLVREKLNMPSGHYYRLVPEVAVKNHLIKIVNFSCWYISVKTVVLFSMLQTEVQSITFSIFLYTGNCVTNESFIGI